MSLIETWDVEDGGLTWQVRVCKDGTPPGTSHYMAEWLLGECHRVVVRVHAMIGGRKHPWIEGETRGVMYGPFEGMCQSREDLGREAVAPAIAQAKQHMAAIQERLQQQLRDSAERAGREWAAVRAILVAGSGKENMAAAWFEPLPQAEA